MGLGQTAFDLVKQENQDTDLVPDAVLAWLHSFKNQVASGAKPRVIVDHLVDLQVRKLGHCDCENPPRSKITAWLHQHHAEYNRTIHDIILEFCAPLRLRRSLKKDPSQQQLLDFLSNNPGPEWIGD